MPANYVLLEKITVGAAGASSVTFSSIPQTGYTDLKLVASARADNANSQNSVALQFNSDTGSNYTYRRLYGLGSAGVGSDTTATTKLLIGYTTAASNTANTFGNGDIYIPNYTSANQKSVSGDGVNENNSTVANAALVAGIWTGTAAITSITVLPWDTPANWASGSTFYLYGVAKLGTTPAISPYATGGDTIMTDGTYWYHTFLSSGTFTPAKSLTTDYLMIAGGGGGASGGGGAGGLLTGSYTCSPSTNYSITIGAGGAAALGGGGPNASQGSNTTGFGLTLIGGGYGNTIGNVDPTGGGAGGSGGGGGAFSGGLTAGGSGTSGQGNTGGTNSSQTASPYPAGGGGGAGSAGQNAVNATTGGAGGSGYTSSISGTSTVYAGGGGGSVYSTGTAGAGGSGGGGAGGSNSGSGTAGTPNRGGGGGGGGVGGSGGSGGSGLVIIRYAI
jgi:hypothetical protein